MSNTAKVGLFMTVALAVLGYLIFRVEDLSFGAGDLRRVDAAFDSVAGLDDKAAVRVAGVRVGRVDGIRLDGKQAVVTILLESPVELRRGSSAAITNLGLLGDKYVELRLGDPAAPLLEDGEPLPGQTPLAWDDAMKKLSNIGGSIEQTLAAVDPKETGETISRLLRSLEETSETIQALVQANRDQVTGTVSNFESLSANLAAELPKLTGQVERLLQQVEAVVAENRGTLRDSLSHVSEVSERMRSSIDDLNVISAKIVAGEGSLGKLVASDEAHERLTSTLGAIEGGVQSLSDTLGKVQRLGLDLDFDGYYLEDAQETRTALAVTLQPEDEDRFYRLGLVDDPRGRLESRSETLTVTGPDGVPATTTTRRLTLEDDITFDAQFGFRWRNAQLRAGLFESTGGAGVDFGLFDRSLLLSIEAFEFGREQDLDPHLRLTGRWQVQRHLYLLGGIDDPLVDRRESLFLGAGITWNDDDLKYLLGAAPRGF